MQCSSKMNFSSPHRCQPLCKRQRLDVDTAALVDGIIQRCARKLVAAVCSFDKALEVCGALVLAHLHVVGEMLLEFLVCEGGDVEGYYTTKLTLVFFCVAFMTLSPCFSVQDLSISKKKKTTYLVEHWIQHPPLPSDSSCRLA